MADSHSTETWRPVVGYEGRYRVSDQGRLYSLRRERILRPSLSRDGYFYCRLYKPRRHKFHYAHALVAAAFLGARPPGNVINHLDADKTNNKPGNLEYTTHKGNAAHAAALGLRARGHRRRNAKLSAAQVLAIRRRLAEGMPPAALAKEYGVTRPTVVRVGNGVSWTWLGKACPEARLPLRVHVRLRPSVYDRFWGKVERRGTGECWPWRGQVNTCNGRGVFRLRGHGYSAPRMAYELTHGSQLEGKVVCHRCDVPLCCNPAHLFLGTPRDNTKDMVRKGRHACGARHGSRTCPGRLPSGSRHWTHLEPENLQRGKCHWSHRLPDRVARGEGHGSQTKPDRVARGEAHGSARLTAEEVRAIRSRYRAGGVTLQQLADEFGLTRSPIHQIVTRKTWRHVP